MKLPEGYRLLFYSDFMSVPLFLATLIGATVLVILFYRLVYKAVPWPVLIGLVALRCLAILAILLLLFKPVLTLTHQVTHRTALCVLIDTSRSMSVRDYPNSPSRLELATAELRPSLAELEKTFDLHLYTFDSIPRQVTGDRLPTEAAGDATNITRAVSGCLAEVPRELLAGVVLLTDGLHNGGGDPVQALAQNGGPPIYPVGIGSDLSAASGFQDIGIAGLEAPEEATVNTRTEVGVNVENTGFADRTIEVQLRDGETTVAAERLVLSNKPGPQKVRLQFTPTRKGSERYEVVIPVDPRERIEENNRQEFYLMVTEPRIKVLYVETLRPEYRSLKPVLETDPNIDVLSLVQVQKGVFLKGGNLRGIDLAAFPTTREQMKVFDVFIVGNLDSSFLSRGQMEALRDLVRDEGKGLLMIGGSDALGPGGYGGSALEEALPVKLGPRSTGQIAEPFTLELTAEGRHHPIFAGTGEFFRAEGQAAEKTLPVLKGCNILGEPKPGAAVLAVHPQVQTNGKPAVVLAVEQFGEGRTAVFAGDTTYQWDLLFKVLGRESPYVKFWGQMVRYLAAKEVEKRESEPGLAFALRKPLYLPGEPVVLQATVTEKEGRTTSFATVRAEVAGPDGKTRSELLSNLPGSSGLYRATLKPEDAGKYKVTLRAEKEGQLLGTAAAEFSVARPNQEFERLSLDEKLLGDLARRSGGRYYRLTMLSELFDALKRGQVAKDEYLEWPLLGMKIVRVPGTQAEVTGTHLLFALFLGLLTTEWLIRRRHLLQ